MASSEKHTFLVTGASSGLGLAIALEALRQGHKVIGTARNTTKAKAQHPHFSVLGGEWLQLDITDANAQETIKLKVEQANVDVLINNAGYGIYGALEDMSEQEIRDQMETNFFGSVKVIKGAIPHFRRARKGTIVNMSSISGLTVTSASGIMYSTSKFALEAITEGLALQLAPFSVRVLIVEPGLFRTNWLEGSYATPAAGLTKDYEDGPVGDTLRRYPTLHGAQEGDPQKAAKRILEVVTRTGMGADEVGNDAMDKAREKVSTLVHNLDAVDIIARSTTHDDALKGGRS
jgi:NAD(P)-dependent dehydrogenase (short-subunit alcohol dehydrogenase family)